MILKKITANPYSFTDSITYNLPPFLDEDISEKILASYLVFLSFNLQQREREREEKIIVVDDPNTPENEGGSISEKITVIDNRQGIVSEPLSAFTLAVRDEEEQLARTLSFTLYSYNVSAFNPITLV